MKATLFYMFSGCNARIRGLIAGVFAQKYDFLQVCTDELRLSEQNVETNQFFAQRFA